MLLAAGGHGHVVAVVGDPGVGKSRLLFELARPHRVDGWLVLEARSAPYGKTTSYLPVAEIRLGASPLGVPNPSPSAILFLRLSRHRKRRSSPASTPRCRYPAITSCGSPVPGTAADILMT